MAGRIAHVRQVVGESKRFLHDVKTDIGQVEGLHRKTGAGFLAACIAAHALGGLSSLYVWAASKAYAESGGNPAAPAATLFGLSFGIERTMGHSAANHFTRLRTVLGKLQSKKEEYDQERQDHRPLKLRQKVGHAVSRAALTVTIGAAGRVGRALVGNPESSRKDLKKHSTRTALGLAAFNGLLGLGAGFAMKLTESKSPGAANRVLDIAQSHWPTMVFVGLASGGLLLTRRGGEAPAAEEPSNSPGQQEQSDQVD